VAVEKRQNIDDEEENDAIIRSAEGWVVELDILGSSVDAPGSVDLAGGCLLDQQDLRSAMHAT
jgi:hypothetical protein